jgi:hypothetical protein
MIGESGELHPPGEETGRDDLPGQFGDRVEIPDVVGDTDENDDEGRIRGSRRSGPALAKMAELRQLQVTPNAVRIPMNIAMPPEPREWDACTSRSRMAG